MADRRDQDEESDVEIGVESEFPTGTYVGRDPGIPVPGASALGAPPPEKAKDDRLGDLQRRFDESEERTKHIFESEQEELKPLREEARKMTSEPIEEPPTPEKPPPRPNLQRELSEQSQAWMGLATFIAMIGAGRTRNAGTTGLMAMAGIFNGIREGNEDRIKHDMKVWEEANKVIAEENKQMAAAYRQRLESKRLNLDQKIEEMKIIASTYHDQLMMEALNRKNLIDAGKLVKGQERIAQDAETAALKKKKLEYDVEKARKAAEPVKPTLTAKQIDILADQENAGDHSWRLAFTGRNTISTANKEAVMERAVDKAASGESRAHATAIFSGEQAASRSIQVRLENVNAYAEVADAMFENAIEVSRRYERTGEGAFNRAINAFRNQTGSPELRELGAALQASANAWAKAINAGGVKTVHDTDIGEKLATPWFTHEDIVATLHQWSTEIDIEKKKLQKVLDEFPERHRRTAPDATAPPTGGGGSPSRPPSLPAGTLWNPARRQWKTPDGKIYNEDLSPASP